MTLAQAMIKEAKLLGEAKFCLAELALALSRVDPRKPALGGLSRGVIVQCLTTVIREIELCTIALPPAAEASPLENYINAAFSEARKC
jgi:hypothetical protein